MIEFQQTGQTRTALTRKEADQQGLDYIYWKDADQTDEYILTDDEYVLVLRSAKVYSNETGERKFVRAWGGCAFTNSDFRFLDFHANGRYSNTNPEASWEETEARKGRMKRAVDVLVASFMVTGRFDWERAAMVYRPGQEIPVASLKRVFRKQYIRDMIQDELKRKYDEMGFTEEWVVEKILKAGAIAEEKGDSLNMLRAAQEGKELLGMGPTTVRATREDSMQMGDNLLKRAESYQIEGD